MRPWLAAALLLLAVPARASDTLSANPLKPLLGILLLEHGHELSARVTLDTSFDLVFARPWFDATLGRLYGEGFRHPDLVVRVGATFLPQGVERGPLLGACAGLSGGWTAASPPWGPVLGLQAGWRFPIAGRWHATPRLLASFSTSGWSPGAELLVGIRI